MKVRVHVGVQDNMQYRVICSVLAIFFVQKVI
jgi:hypothetical protein